MRKYLSGFIFLILSVSLSALPPFKETKTPEAPDYSNEFYWSTLPFREDAADMIPKSETWISDSIKQVDVFYIYPTLFTKGNTWNADLQDKKLNKRIDHLPVKYHASVFNQVGRVYTPRYRQANIDAYFDTTDARQQCFDLAYQDIKTAFEYYLQHYNNGRPIIIASHSQGTTHSRRLLKDFFDTPEMKAKLVCAYAVGYALYRDSYEVLTPCQKPEETNCYVTWATFKEGFEYKDKLNYFGDVCVNPVSWTTDTTKAYGNSGILLNVNRKKKFKASAQIHQQYLWSKTNLTFMRRKNILHLVDYNLFWYDIRKNAQQRTAAYLNGK